MDYTNKVVRISAYVLFSLGFITLIYQVFQNGGDHNFWKSMRTVLFFLFPVPINFFYFRKHSGDSLVINLILLTLNIFTTVGLIFIYYLFPLTH
jgi:Na+-driven multidrug efflux pump